MLSVGCFPLGRTSNNEHPTLNVQLGRRPLAARFTERGALVGACIQGAEAVRSHAVNNRTTPPWMVWWVLWAAMQAGVFAFYYVLGAAWTQPPPRRLIRPSGARFSFRSASAS